jgi:hypothetical protein
MPESKKRDSPDPSLNERMLAVYSYGMRELDGVSRCLPRSRSCSGASIQRARAAAKYFSPASVSHRGRLFRLHSGGMSSVSVIPAIMVHKPQLIQTLKQVRVPKRLFGTQEEFCLGRGGTVARVRSSERRCRMLERDDRDSIWDS